MSGSSGESLRAIILTGDQLSLWGPDKISALGTLMGLEVQALYGSDDELALLSAEDVKAIMPEQGTRTPIAIGRTAFQKFSEGAGYSTLVSSKAWTAVSSLESSVIPDTHPPVQRLEDDANPDIRHARDRATYDLWTIRDRLEATQGKGTAWGGRNDEDNATPSFLAHMSNELLPLDENGLAPLPYNELA